MAWHWDKLVDAGGGGDYIGLDEFEAAADGEDASGTDGIRARVKGNPDDGISVYYAGWQAGYDSDTWIVIEAETGYEPDGINDAAGSDALLSASQVTWESTENMYIRFSNLESNRSGIAFSIAHDAGGHVIVTKCVHRDSSAAQSKLVRIQGIDSAVSVYVGGCLGKNNSGAYAGLIYCNDADGTITVINCTGVGYSHTGANLLLQAAGTAIAKNCALGCSNGDDVSGTWSETTNKSQDDGDITCDDADDFTEPSTEDYTVYDTDSALYHSGTAIADSWFTTHCATDFAGTSWNNPPSVGCFEYVGAGPSISMPVVMLQMDHFNSGEIL